MNNKILNDSRLDITRRHFFANGTKGLGAAALASLLSEDNLADAAKAIVPKAKRVIYLFQSGGPSQLDLFDYKPQLNNLHGKEVPASVFNG